MDRAPWNPRRHDASEPAERLWLRAEATGDDASAEAALRELFGALPEASPRPGFARRAVRRAGVAPAGRDVFARRGVRWAIACGLFGAALALLVVPGALGPLLVPFAGSLSLAGVFSGASQLAILAGRWIGAGAAYWRLASDLGGACALALSKPPVAGALLAMVATSAGAFRALYRLMSPERSAFHA